MAIGESINKEQNEDILDKLIDDVKLIFTKGEKFLSGAIQKKPVLTVLPDAVIVTNKRVIHHSPGFFGKKFKDYLWGEMEEVHLEEKNVRRPASIRIQEEDW